MKRIILILMAMLWLAACQPVKGNLTVHSPLTLFNRDFEKVQLKPGIYESEFLWKKRHLTLELRLKDDFGFKQRIVFSIPEHLIFPERSGTISIPSSENLQPWDLVVQTASSVYQSEIFWGYEPCYSHRCSRYWRHRHDRYGYWDDGICQGEKQVKYYYRDTVTDLKVMLNEPGTNNTMARFEGRSRDRAKIYTFEGPCY